MLTLMDPYKRHENVQYYMYTTHTTRNVQLINTISDYHRKFLGEYTI